MAFYILLIGITAYCALEAVWQSGPRGEATPSSAVFGFVAQAAIFVLVMGFLLERCVTGCCDRLGAP